MASLSDIRAGEDAAAIHRAVESLGRDSEAFAARRMDASIRRALTGVSLDELEQGDS